VPRGIRDLTIDAGSGFAIFAAAPDGGFVTFSSTESGYFITLQPGDELVRCLIQFARDQEIDMAMITGAGSISEVELGTGSAGRRDQRRSRFAEPLEACALTGTLTLVDGEPFPRLFGSFARLDNTMLGGHIFQAVCGAGAEVLVQLLEPGRRDAVAAGAPVMSQSSGSGTES
jgi:uncharacterized protein